ncbi:MAG: hypothetical protein HY649_11135 [Acidobacteria bacterium]|nr:hypothetical protein [Acidobacteriota bacterium]
MLELLLLFAFCVVLALGSLAAGAWVLVTAEAVGVEQIFLLIVCMLLGVTFLGFGAWMARSTQLRELWKATPAQTPSPSAQTTSGNIPKEEAAREKTGQSAS